MNMMPRIPRPKKKPTLGAFTPPRYEINFHNYLLSKSTALLLLGNAWVMVGVALPMDRPFDALVSFGLGILCFWLRR